MRAAVFRQVGDPATVVHVEDISTPHVSPAEVLVDVDASVMQPRNSSSSWASTEFSRAYPSRGLDGTGVVVDSAPDAGLPPGTRVAFRHPGCWADEVAVPAASCYVVPADVPVELAAQFSLNPVTAWALIDEVGAAPGDWVAVSAAGSAVARLVADLASSPVLHADHSDLATALLDRTGGRRARWFLDSVGGDVLAAVLPALRPGRTIVSYGVLDNTPVPVHNSDLIYSCAGSKDAGATRLVLVANTAAIALDWVSSTYVASAADLAGAAGERSAQPSLPPTPTT